MRIILLNFKAFALIEALAAMTILSIGVLAAFMTIEWTLRTNPAPTRLKARVALQELCQKTIQEKRFIDESVMLDQYVAERKIYLLSPLKDAYVLTFKAIDGAGKEVATYESIVFLP